MEVKLSNTAAVLRVCSYRRGAVTLMSMNLGKTPARISVPAVFSNSTVEAFVLESEQPGEEGLYSRCLNVLNEAIFLLVRNLLRPQRRQLFFTKYSRLCGSAVNLR